MKHLVIIASEDQTLSRIIHQSLQKHGKKAQELTCEEAFAHHGRGDETVFVVSAPEASPDAMTRIVESLRLTSSYPPEETVSREELEARLDKAQEKLSPSERQTLIAELAGTVAHELNQPLTSILGYAELLRRRGANQDDQEVVHTIIREAERMADVIRKLAYVTDYKTKDYVGEQRILDLDNSGGMPGDTEPPKK